MLLKIKTLDEIGLAHGTDKASSVHDYLVRYEEVFEPIRESARKILEIGIAGGESLRTWAEYFPNATIFGIDHNEKYFNAAHLIDPARIQPILGEAEDPKLWGQLVVNWGADFDIVIDDGGHHSSQIIRTFPQAFAILRSGGFYALEDMHTSYDPAYNRTDGFGTAMDFFQDGINIMNDFGAGNCGKPGPAAAVDWFWFSKSLLILKKR